MKKIIALALALIMALSMGVVAFAGETATKAPGEKITWELGVKKSDYKLTYDFTSAEDGFKGISAIESIEWVKNEERTYDVVLTLKENLTSVSDKAIAGVVTITSKEKVDGEPVDVQTLDVAEIVGNKEVFIEGAKKAADAVELTVGEDGDMFKNTVMNAEDGAGYVSFTDGYSLTGLVKVENNEKAQVYFEEEIDEDTMDAIEAYLGEDYDAIVEYYNFGGSGFKSDVAFTYEAYAEDPHFFYAWDGEKFVDLEGKYNDDEEVDAYEFTAAAKGIIIVTDVEIVAGAADTKNPDTGANDVVGVAAALAVVSLVAAGAVSLKK